MSDFGASTGSIRIHAPATVHGFRPWLFWCVGLLTYFFAIVGRSSLAGLGTDVAIRFDAGSATLALFATMQLAVYGGMQIPAGLLLDRFGARVVITIGMLLMAGGSVWIAFAGDVTSAILARALTGAGDAMIFPSVLRLLAVWFPVRRVPILQQITGQVGQLGQIASVLVLVFVAHAFTWEIAFAAFAATFIVMAILDIALVREPPKTEHHNEAGRIGALLKASIREPGTRLGFWVHFVTPFTGTAFALLWGIPFLTAGEGLSPAVAGILFSVFVLAGIVFAPVFGYLSGTFPRMQVKIVIVSVLAQVASLAAVVFWPGPAPVWLLVVWVVTLTSGGAASMIAFDIARSSNPITRLSTATGIVNMGGFVAALVAIFVIGAALDLQGANPAAYERVELRIAMSTVAGLWVIGLAGVGFESWRRRRKYRLGHR